MRFAALALAAAILAGCTPPPLQTEASQSGRIEIVPLKTYRTFQSRVLMWMAGIRGIDAANAIDCYRIIYPSTDAKGRPIRLSGLLALPHGPAPRGLVSFQHGTTSDRDEVPSNLSTDGLAAAILFAGNGYAAIAPDYTGLGVSKGAQSYLVASDTARSVVDMIHAVRHIQGVPGDPPFLVGFSEGGYASLAAQRAMEAHDERVLAVAAIAGAYNLRAVSVPFSLKGESPQASVYLALWVRGYAKRYGHPLDSAFTPRYAALIPRLFDTPHDAGDAVRALPRDPRALFRPEVLDAIAGKGDHWLVDALKQNEMGDWAAKAPIRLYYGSYDVDVTPLEAATTARQMAARGSNIETVDVGPGDHNTSILMAVPLIVKWLESLHAEPPRQIRSP